MHKRLQITLLTLLTLLTPPPSVFAADAWNDLQNGDVATIQSLTGLFSNVLSVVLRLMGLTTFIMILVGGVQFLISNGDPKAMEAAQQTITTGIIGLILVIAAYLILTFIGFFTGIPDLIRFSFFLPN